MWSCVLKGKFMAAPRSRSGRYFEASAGMSMDEQFQRISPKVFWQVFLTSRAACIMVCMSSRLLRHNWAWEETSPGRSLQCWLWLMCKDEGECDSTLWRRGERFCSLFHSIIHQQQINYKLSEQLPKPRSIIQAHATWRKSQQTGGPDSD